MEEKQYGVEFLEQLEIVSKMITDNTKILTEAKDKIPEFEQELVDFYHVIELEPKMNGGRRMYIFAELRKLLIARRDNKDILDIATSIKDSTKNVNHSMISTIKSIKSNVSQIHSRNETRKYKPRRRFDLFDPEADYVSMTPEWQAYLDDKERQKQELIDSLIKMLPEVTPVPPVATNEQELHPVNLKFDLLPTDPIELTKEGAQNLVEANTFVPVEDGRIIEGTEEDAKKVLEAHENKKENLVYSTEETEEEPPSKWASMLTRFSFKKK